MHESDIRRLLPFYSLQESEDEIVAEASSSAGRNDFKLISSYYLSIIHVMTAHVKCDNSHCVSICCNVHGPE